MNQNTVAPSYAPDVATPNSPDQPPAKAFGFKEIAVRVLLVGFVLLVASLFWLKFFARGRGRKVAVPE